jgi:hypothetical protein
MATHLIVDAWDSHSVCGVKHPLPVVLASFAQTHVDGYGLEVCRVCQEATGVRFECDGQLDMFGEAS